MDILVIKMILKLNFLKVRFFSYIFICFFMVFSILQALEQETKNSKPVDNIKEHYTKNGGSMQGFLLIEKAINSSKNESLVAKNNINYLQIELQDVISKDTFDEKKYMIIKSKINDVMIRSVNNKDKIMISLLKDLSTTDRKIMIKMINNMFFIDVK